MCTLFEDAAISAISRIESLYSGLWLRQDWGDNYLPRLYVDGDTDIDMDQVNDELKAAFYKVVKRFVEQKRYPREERDAGRAVLTAAGLG